MEIVNNCFNNDGNIPISYTCDGEGKSPELYINDIPENTKSLALIVEDPDAPIGVWIHWMIWNIPREVNRVYVGVVPDGVIGKNSGGKNEWYYICPPDGEHRYFFKIFALDTLLNLDPNISTRDDFYSSVEGHVLDQAELMGRYSR